MLPRPIFSVVSKAGAFDPIELDLSKAFFDVDLHHASSLLKKLVAKDEILFIDLSAGIPGKLWELFQKEAVRVPALYEIGAHFAQEIGGTAGLVSWRAVAKERNEAIYSVESAKRLLRTVSNAAFVPLAEFADSQVYDDFRDEYCDPESAIDNGFDFDRLKMEVGPRNWSAPPDEEAAYNALVNAWVRKHAYPFAFGTNQVRWNGISANDLIDILEDDPEIQPSDFIGAVWNGIESDLDDNHHDEAYELIKDGNALDSALLTWLAAYRDPSRVGPPDPRDITAWNAKQEIVSIFPDMGRVVGLFGDTTYEEVQAWCENHLAKANQKVADVEALWRQPYARPEDEIANWKRLGFTVKPNSTRYGRIDSAWTWTNDANEQCSEQFLTLELCIESLTQSNALSGQESECFA